MTFIPPCIKKRYWPNNAAHRPPVRQDLQACPGARFVQQKDLYPVKFFEKDSAADLTGAINPVNPVKKTNVLSSNLMVQSAESWTTLCMEEIVTI